MNGSEKLNIDTIFCSAIEIESPADRQAYLQRACGDNPAVIRQVERLMAAHFREGSILDAPARALCCAPDAPPAERVCSVIGPYKLLELIGEGGMGLVYMAEQQQPVRRQLALKIIQPGMDSRQVIARFEVERQALAMMDHPNIAKVFDAGATDSGRPYFVMELVRGIPITQFCDQQKHDTRQRLELFVQVCRAIQHAHQKGIIHRDIKPTNVLVEVLDGTPVAKVIDFGVAKAIGQRLTDGTIDTTCSQMVGTPLYMSPEQTELNALDVDTRSDVYSLGVLLYELLTGTTPFDKDRLQSAGFDEMRRIIREEEPETISNRLAKTRGGLRSDGRRVRSDNKHRGLRQLFAARSGFRIPHWVELDWIVMKALEKDRNRRYETANGLALDLHRYLHDEAVQACPPSAAYRFRKFAARNKRILGTSAVVAVALLLGVGSLGWTLRDRAARRIEAELRAQNAVEEVTRLRDQKRWADARAAARRVESLLAPEVSRADLRQQLRGLLADLDMVDRLERIRLGQAQTKNEWWDLAAADPAYDTAFREYGIDAAHLDAAVAAGRVRTSAIREQLIAALDDWIFVIPTEKGAWRERVRAIAGLADPDEWRNRFRDPAIQRDRQSLEKLAARPEVADLSPSTLVLLGRSLQQAGSAGRAVEVLANGQCRFPTDFWLNIELARMLRWHIKPPRHDESAGYCRAALAIRPDSAGAWVGLGTSLRLPEHVDEAIAAFRQAIALQKDYAEPHHQLGRALLIKRAWGEADASFREALRLKPDAALVHQDLGRALRAAGDLPGALNAFRQAALLQPDNVNSWALLSSTCLTMGDSSAHRQVCADMVRRFSQTKDPNVAAGVVCNCVPAPDVPPDMETLVQLAYQAGKSKHGLAILGAALYRAGDYQGAVLRLEQANSGGAWDLLLLAMAHHQLGNQDQARACLKRATLQIDANRLPWPEGVHTEQLRREAVELIEHEPQEGVGSQAKS